MGLASRLFDLSPVHIDQRTLTYALAVTAAQDRGRDAHAQSRQEAQPAEDNLSLEPWVAGWICSMGAGDMCVSVCMQYTCVLVSRLSRVAVWTFVVLYFTVHTTHLSSK